MKTQRETPAELERESRRVLRRAALKMAELARVGSEEAIERQFDYMRGIMRGRESIRAAMGPDRGA